MNKKQTEFIFTGMTAPETRKRTCTACGELKARHLFGGSNSTWCNVCRNANRNQLALRAEFSGITEKECRRCRLKLPVETFFNTKFTRDGFYSICKPCFSAKYPRNTQSAKSKRSKQYRDNWTHRAWTTAKMRAVKNNVPFTIEESDIVVPDVCPVLGMKLKIGVGAKSENSPSLDRRIPSLGYVPGNVFVISWMANRLKGPHTDPEIFEKVAAYLRQP